MENHQAPPPAPNSQPERENTELSLRVLRRYQPTIRSILAIAANAVTYSYSEATQEWEKRDVDGTMFVCEQDPVVTPTGHELPRYCVFVLNRRSLDNLVIELLRVTECEFTQDLITLRLENDNATNGAQGEKEGVPKNILGLWIHNDAKNPREVYANLILAAWDRGRKAFDEYVHAATAGVRDNGVPLSEPQAGASTAGRPAAGKRLSMSELFGRKNGV
jgi:hypothetical protein